MGNDVGKEIHDKLLNELDNKKASNSGDHTDSEKNSNVESPKSPPPKLSKTSSIELPSPLTLFQNSAIAKLSIFSRSPPASPKQPPGDEDVFQMISDQPSGSVSVEEKALSSSAVDDGNEITSINLGCMSPDDEVELSDQVEEPCGSDVAEELTNIAQKLVSLHSDLVTDLTLTLSVERRITREQTVHTEYSVSIHCDGSTADTQFTRTDRTNTMATDPSTEHAEIQQSVTQPDNNSADSLNQSVTQPDNNSADSLNQSVTQPDNNSADSLNQSVTQPDNNSADSLNQSVTQPDNNSADSLHNIGNDVDWKTNLEQIDQERDNLLDHLAGNNVQGQHIFRRDNNDTSLVVSPDLTQPSVSVNEQDQSGNVVDMDNLSAEDNPLDVEPNDSAVQHESTGETDKGESLIYTDANTHYNGTSSINENDTETAHSSKTIIVEPQIDMELSGHFDPSTSVSDLSVFDIAQADSVNLEGERSEVTAESVEDTPDCESVDGNVRSLADSDSQFSLSDIEDELDDVAADSVNNFSTEQTPVGTGANLLNQNVRPLTDIFAQKNIEAVVVGEQPTGSEGREHPLIHAIEDIGNVCEESVQQSMSQITDIDNKQTVAQPISQHTVVGDEQSVAQPISHDAVVADEQLVAQPISHDAEVGGELSVAQPISHDAVVGDEQLVAQPIFHDSVVGDEQLVAQSMCQNAVVRDEQSQIQQDSEKPEIGDKHIEKQPVSEPDLIGVDSCLNVAEGVVEDTWKKIEQVNVFHKVDRSWEDDETDLTFSIGDLGALNDEAEHRLAARRAARQEAREIRMREIERQQKEAEQREKENKNKMVTSNHVPRAPSATRYTATRQDSDDSTTSEDLRTIKKELNAMDEKYTKAMMDNAQLDNEKQMLRYEVDLLKDRLDDLTEEQIELQRECKDKTKDIEQRKRENTNLKDEVAYLKQQLQLRDQLIEEYGLVFVSDATVADDEDAERKKEPSPEGATAALVTPQAMEILNKHHGGLDDRLKRFETEQEELEVEVKKLKQLLDQEKERSALAEKYSTPPRVSQVSNGPDIADMQMESQRQINEYKFKLKKAQQEITTLEGNVIRLESQAKRYKQSAENSERNEEELKGEKRKMQRELRETQASIEELQTENKHLKNRMEKMKSARNAILKS